MTKSFEVSQSKVNCWRKCRQEYWYKYIEKLRKRSVGRPLSFGRIVHEMQEQEVIGNDPFDHLAMIEKKAGKMFREEAEEYGDLIADIGFIMQDYYAYYEKDPLKIVPIKKKMAEHPFEVEVVPGIVATGKIDAFTESRNKLRWILERKNHKDIPDEDARWRNLQSCVYTKLVELAKIPIQIEGLCWDYIRTKRPTRPQMLKNGTLSKRSIDTLPSVVVDTCEKLKVPVKSVWHLYSSAQKNMASYYKRIYTPTKKHLVNMIFSDFVETAKEMKVLHGKTQVKTIGRHCSWCSYESLCRAQLRDLDIDFIKKQEYYVHEGKDNENDWDAETSSTR